MAHLSEQTVKKTGKQTALFWGTGAKTIGQEDTLRFSADSSSLRISHRPTHINDVMTGMVITFFFSFSLSSGGVLIFLLSRWWGEEYYSIFFRLGDPKTVIPVVFITFSVLGGGA